MVANGNVSRSCTTHCFRNSAASSSTAANIGSRNRHHVRNTCTHIAIPAPHDADRIGPARWKKSPTSGLFGSFDGNNASGKPARYSRHHGRASENNTVSLSTAGKYRQNPDDGMAQASVIIASATPISPVLSRREPKIGFTTTHSTVIVAISRIGK